MTAIRYVFLAALLASGTASIPAQVVSAGSCPPPTQPASRVKMTIEARSVVGPPFANLMPGAHESNTQIRVFDERLNVTLPSNLVVDQTTSTLGSSGVIPAGTRVNSHLIHFDAVRSWGDRGVGRITFAGKILGIITKDSDLEKSDAILALPNVHYPAGTPDRGLELGTGNESWQDYPGSYWNYQDLVLINGNTLTIDFEDYENLDEARIVTQAK